MTEANTLSAIEGTTMGVRVARGTPSSDYSDVGVILEGVLVLHDLENVALPSAMLFGLFYTFFRYEVPVEALLHLRSYSKGNNEVGCI